MKAFEIPDGAQIVDISQQKLTQTAALKPTDLVICINRGREPLETTFDGRHIPIPVGRFLTEYGAAQHMKARLIVPGTRDLEIGGFVSWIGILGSEDQRFAVDPPEDCEPFTYEELQKFGESVEGLAPTGRQPVEALQMERARRMSRMQGAGGGFTGEARPMISAAEQANEAARDNAEHVFDRPEDSATREAESEAAAEGVAPVRQRRRG